MSLRYLLIILIIIEILLHGSFIDLPFNSHLRPIIIAIIGIAIGWIGIVQSKSKTDINRDIGIPYIAYILPIFAIAAAVYAYQYLYALFISSPIQVAESDIIPTIQELVSRFLAGDTVYEPVDFDSYQVIPGYLPMQWMPFSMAALLDFDFRWIPYITLGVSISILVFRCYMRKGGYESLFSIVILLVFLFFSLDDDQPKMYLTTIEWTMASFYILLCAFIDSKKFWVIGIVLFLCCFSRYSLLFWLLPFALVYYYRQSFQFNLSAFIVLLILALLFYGFPFFFSDPSIFLDSIAYYTTATEHAWIPSPWVPDGLPPEHMDKGFGFAFYFWTYLDYLPVTDQVAICITTHRILSIGVAVAMTFYYIRHRANIVHVSLFLLAVLKIYFVFFYGFIQIPYLYLMTIPCVVSIMLLYPHEQKRTMIEN